ncbi:Eco57I restriction-modification methylase domain-containing protein [Curtobacterium flaccumfaciens]|uniref:Eco57I restriction-modification methylase domain-containing protein n=1 Tax=Curtobacterium flaccumfaciens TaxID=2035 RepID=UPI00217D0BA5|nr:DNA methyltransferase [Curtobacterium flaccumfaciens]MCS6554214.1 hypothetical protein [Curtobacterium flaccumfaciens]
MTLLNRAASLQHTFLQGGLSEMFVEQLGWSSPTEVTLPIQVDGDNFAPTLVASLKGFRVYAIKMPERPTRQRMRQVDSQLAQLSPERMQVFQGPDAWFWHWPRRTNAGTTTFESVETAPNSLPTFLAQRLTGLEFTTVEHSRGITLAQVRDRVHGNFDATNVTRKFYDRFETEHDGLARAIVGIPEGDRVVYATTLLNRLMFLYFMQKKEFLNGDSRYLENTLASVRALRGPDQYYSFYRDALLPLFFDKLNDPAQHVADSEIAGVLGDVPYVNGGIFGRTQLEEECADTLVVPDSAFESILSFFAEFNWHLDTRPTGNPNEINPEVIGYIFEQYINFATSGKKEHGAYYTAHDVTAHMVAQTLVPRVLDNVVGIVPVFDLLQADPDRYIQPAMLHGWNAATSDWIETSEGLSIAWAGDPVGWSALDAGPGDESAQLAAETWVETFHRRERVESLRSRIAAGEIASVNDLVTENLNSSLLLTDAIDRVSSPVTIAGLFRALTELAIFDPTCGSGAFLFAALESLEDIYAHVIDAARTVQGSAGVVALLQQVDAQPSARYFIRKHIAIRNLYGTDLMPGAIETAKLRIFLALAACVDRREELQPLPDLDFNLKVGNLVVGFKDTDDVDRVGADLLTSARLTALQPKIDDYAGLYDEFVTAVEWASPKLNSMKAELQLKEQQLRDASNEIYAEVTRVAVEDYPEWLDTVRPFHWFCEFPAVLRRGGFDVIIGNPPYVRMGQLPGYTAIGYETSRCPDLFAVCYERSLSLLASTGRHAFIVMAALAISEDYRPLREVIAKRSGSEWWATFGRIPAGLFPSHVRVRNTILVLGPGQGIRATRHHLHKAVQRPWLLPTIEYASVRRADGEWPVRGGVAAPILQRLSELGPVAGARSREVAHVRPTAAYWVPVLPAASPVVDADGRVLEQVDSGLKKIGLFEGESVADVVGVLGGKISYLWWVLLGDDFHINARELEAPRALAKLAAGTPGWSAAVQAVHAAIPTATFVSINAKKYYFNVRWSNLRNVTDAVDRLALTALGGTDTDWRALNILYRQVMRSSGDSAKGRYVTPAEYAQILGW